MALITETLRITDILLFEEGEQVNFVRDSIIVASGSNKIAIGQILGKVTSSGKYVPVAPAASDGSQTAAAVNLVAVDATSADATSVAITRGPAIIKTSNLTYTSGMNTSQKNAALAQLATLGIINRQDLGV